MNELYIALVVVGGLVLVLGVFSNPIKNKSFLSAPLLALVLGIVLGPQVSDLLDPARWGHQETIVEEAARLTLAIGLMGIALRLPPRHFIDQWRPMAVMIGLVMPLMWVSTGLLVYLVFQLPLVIAFLIGAILTPTDPIVASSIVTSSSARENLPERIRHNLSGESGANDGLAYLFVLLPILLITHGSGSPVRHWLVSTLLWEVGGAAVLGGLVGVGAGWLLRWGEAKELIEKTSFLSYTVALSLLTLGSAKLLGTDGILAVFVAGLAYNFTADPRDEAEEGQIEEVFNRLFTLPIFVVFGAGILFDNVVGGSDRAEEADIQETVNQFFTLPVFTLVGLVLPVKQWGALGWQGALIVVAVLLLRRLPAVLALRRWMPPINRTPDALFLGWFGPIGVSALLYAMLALRRVGNESVWVISSLVICASIVVHGVTATPFTRLYAKQTAEH